MAKPAASRWLTVALALAALGYDPSAPAEVAKLPLSLLVALAALALALPTMLRRSRPLVTAAGVPWLALCGWSALSLAWADHPAPAALGGWIAGAALMLVASGWQPEQLRRTAGEAALIVAAGSSLAAILQALRGTAIVGLQGNPNWLGLVLACALPLAIDHALGLERGPARVAAGACVLVGACAVLLSGSRAAWVALAAATLLLAARRWRWLAAAPLFAIGYAWLSGDLLASLRGRLWIWQATLTASGEHPLAGHGTGEFPFAFLDAQGDMLSGLAYDEAAVRFVNATSAHNDWLQLLLEGGLPALLLAAAALAMAAWQLRRSWPGGAACVLAVMVAAAGDAPMRLTSVILLVALVLAATPPLAPRRPDRLLAIAALLATVALLPRAASDWIGHRRLTSARALVLDARATALAGAAKASPSSGEIALARGLARLELGQPKAALPSLERSRELLANVGTDVAIGNCQLQLGNAGAAISAYRRALARHPALVRARVNLAEAHRTAGALDEAERQLTIARELQPHHPKLKRIAEQLRRDRIDEATR